MALNERLLKRDSSMCMNHTLRAVVKVMTSDTITTISSGRSVYVNTCSINTSSSNSDKKVKENSFIKNEDTRFCHLRGNMIFFVSHHCENGHIFWHFNLGTDSLASTCNSPPTHNGLLQVL